jgi:uncharacterized protein
VGRIRKAYEIRFRTLLQRVRARRLEPGVQWLIHRAGQLAQREKISEADALTRLYEALAARPAFKDSSPRGVPTRFVCDSGLGGLARWLRAAGFDPFWQAHIDDDQLIAETQKFPGSAILTTDSLLMERRLLRDGLIPAFWLPPTLSIAEQLARVFREFGLRPGHPRCMRCGGQLDRVEKEALKERIPPRTYRWLDEYFVCRRCGQLFWRGTHWDRIRKELGQLGQ